MALSGCELGYSSKWWSQVFSWSVHWSCLATDWCSAVCCLCWLISVERLWQSVVIKPAYNSAESDLHHCWYHIMMMMTYQLNDFMFISRWGWYWNTWELIWLVLNINWSDISIYRSIHCGYGSLLSDCTEVDWWSYITTVCGDCESCHTLILVGVSYRIWDLYLRCWVWCECINPSGSGNHSVCVCLW